MLAGARDRDGDCARGSGARCRTPIANTCFEATIRFGAELGYDVTAVKDATAGFSEDEMHAALDVNIPNYANAIVGARDVVRSLSALEMSGGPAPVPASM